MSTVTSKHNRILGEYFTHKLLYVDNPFDQKPNIRKLVEQPWQLTKACSWEKATETLCNLEFIQAKAAAKMTFDLADDFNHLLQTIPDNEENIQREKEREALLKDYVRTGKKMEIPQSINPLADEQREAKLTWIFNHTGRLEKLNNYFQFLTEHTIIFQSYASEIKNLSTQQAWNKYKNGPVGDAATEKVLNSNLKLLLRTTETRPSWNPSPIVLRNLSTNINKDGEELRAPGDKIYSVSISADCKLAVTSSIEAITGNIKFILWNLENGKQLKIFLASQTSSFCYVAMSLNGERAVSTMGELTSILWDIKSGNPCQTLRGHTNSVTSVSITADGKKVFTGSADSTCILWDAENGSILKTLLGHNSIITSVAITPDGRFAVSGSRDATCIVWNLELGEPEVFLKGHTDTVNSVDISANGKCVVSGSSDNLGIIWDIESGNPLKILKKHTGPIYSISITADGKYVITASHDKTCVLWDFEFGNPIKSLFGHTSPVLAVKISPDGKFAFSGSAHNSCILWDIEIGISINNLLNIGSVQIQAILPDREKALTFFYNSTVYESTCILWDIESGNTLKTMKTPSIAYALAVKADGKIAHLALRDKWIIWNLKSGNVFESPNVFKDPISSVLFTKKKKIWAQRNICISQDLMESSSIKLLNGHNDDIISIAATPNEKYVITASKDSNCVIWEIETGKQLKILNGHKSYVKHIAISSDSKKVISASLDGKCILWDLETGALLKTLIGHNGGVHSVAMTEDGKYALSASNDRTCILWDIDSEEIITRFFANDSINTLSLNKNSVILGTESGEIVKLILPNFHKRNFEPKWKFWK